MRITIERETLLPCPFCGDDGDKGRQEVTQMTEGYNKFARITCRACGAMCPEENWNRRAALAAQPATVDGHLKCGHHQSLAINSAETGEFLYCDLCDAKSRCRDAEAMEAELRAALAAQPAQPADAQPTGQSPCARHCEAPAFEGEIRRLKREATIKDSLTIRPPAPAAVPLTDEQRNDCIEAWSSRGWGDRLGEVVRICIAIERAHGITAAGDKP